ncbi:MAG: hypothetical protein FJW39_03785 [Acidobacteria bacterium]|nr:hypothetical protein [Acidobacteriota bacterium]
MGGNRAGRREVIERRILYQSLPSQKAFHAAEERFKGYSGPIGSGKSVALCQEAVRLAYLNPGRAGLLGAPTYRMLADATARTLREILAENQIPHEWNHSDNIITMGDSGSKILLRSLHDAESLRGTNLAWFGVDELTYCEEEAWTRLEGRLRDPKAKRLGGFAVWTPKAHDWVYRRFVEPGGDGYRVILAKPFENTHLLNAVPDFYDRLKKSYDEQFFRQEVMGEYLAVHKARVYHAFDRKIHAVKLERRLDQPLLWALDFNVDPMCSLVAQVAGGEIRVLGEIVLRRAGTVEACGKLREKFLPHYRGVTVYGDASGNRMQTTGSSDFQMIRDYFARNQWGPFTYRVPRANPAVRDRIALVNAKLRSADGDVSLRVDPSCVELIKDFEEVSYLAGSSSIDKDRDKSRTHLSDALGYLAWEEFGPKPRVGEQDRPLF